MARKVEVDPLESWRYDEDWLYLDARERESRAATLVDINFPKQIEIVFSRGNGTEDFRYPFDIEFFILKRRSPYERLLVPISSSAEGGDDFATAATLHRAALPLGKQHGHLSAVAVGAIEAVLDLLSGFDATASEVLLLMLQQGHPPRQAIEATNLLLGIDQ